MRRLFFVSTVILLSTLAFDVLADAAPIFIRNDMDASVTVKFVRNHIVSCPGNKCNYTIGAGKTTMTPGVTWYANAAVVTYRAHDYRVHQEMFSDSAYSVYRANNRIHIRRIPAISLAEKKLIKKQ